MLQKLRNSYHQASQWTQHHTAVFVLWFTLCAGLFGSLLWSTNIFAANLDLLDCNTATNINVPVAECTALMNLYTTTSGATVWINNAGRNTDSDICSWYGITCNETYDSVESISMYDNNINGDLPSEIGNLANLTYLWLQYNGITSIPDTIGNLTKLEWLYLDNNKISVIPDSIGNLIYVNQLYLNSNFIETIPSTIWDMSWLRNLVLTDNQITSIPDSIGNLSLMQYIYLWNNYLSSIPYTIGNLSNLYELELRDNELSDLPLEIQNLTSLWSLSLENNCLIGQNLDIDVNAFITTRDPDREATQDETCVGWGKESDLTFTFTPDKTEVYSWDTVTYTLTVTNSWTEAIDDVAIYAFWSISIETESEAPGLVYVSSDRPYDYYTQPAYQTVIWWEQDLCIPDFLNETGVYWTALESAIINSQWYEDNYGFAQAYGFMGTYTGIWDRFINDYCPNYMGMDVHNCFGYIGVDISTLTTENEICWVDELDFMWHYTRDIWSMTPWTIEIQLVMTVDWSTLTSGDTIISAACIQESIYSLECNQDLVAIDQLTYLWDSGAIGWFDTSLVTISKTIAWQVLQGDQDYTPESKNYILLWAQITPETTFQWPITVWKQIPYMITVKNNSDQKIDNVSIKDFAPAWMILVWDWRLSNPTYVSQIKEYGVPGDTCYEDLLQNEWLYWDALDDIATAKWTYASFEDQFLSSEFSGQITDPSQIWAWYANNCNLRNGDETQDFKSCIEQLQNSTNSSDLIRFYKSTSTSLTSQCWLVVENLQEPYYDIIGWYSIDAHSLDNTKGYSIDAYWESSRIFYGYVTSDYTDTTTVVNNATLSYDVDWYTYSAQTSKAESYQSAWSYCEANYVIAKQPKIDVVDITRETIDESGKQRVTITLQDVSIWSQIDGINTRQSRAQLFKKSSSWDYNLAAPIETYENMNTIQFTADYIPGEESIYDRISLILGNINQWNILQANRVTDQNTYASTNISIDCQETCTITIPDVAYTFNNSTTLQAVENIQVYEEGIWYQTDLTQSYLWSDRYMYISDKKIPIIWLDDIITNEQKSITTTVFPWIENMFSVYTLGFGEQSSIYANIVGWSIWQLTKFAYGTDSSIQDKEKYESVRASTTATTAKITTTKRDIKITKRPPTNTKSIKVKINGNEVCAKFEYDEDADEYNIYLSVEEGEQEIVIAFLDDLDEEIESSSLQLEVDTWSKKSSWWQSSRVQTDEQAGICELRKDCSDSFYDQICGPCEDHNAPYDKSRLIDFPIEFTKQVGEVMKSMTCNLSKELVESYVFSKDLSITTVPDICDADIMWPLRRKHLAKFLSVFAVTILDKETDDNIVCEFNDTQDQSDEFKLFTKISCKLGLMWLNRDGTPDKSFRPDDIVTRAEFGVAFDRAINWPKNNTEKNDPRPRYEKHLQELQGNGIMTQIDSPNDSEIRWYVMTMMMRAYKLLQ